MRTPEVAVKIAESIMATRNRGHEVKECVVATDEWAAFAALSQTIIMIAGVRIFPLSDIPA